MGWSKTAPTLPPGASWGGAKTSTQYSANHYKIRFTAYIARLSRTRVAIRVDTTASEGTYGDYYPPSTYYLKAGAEAANTSLTWTSRSQKLYWTGELAASTIRVIAGVSSLSVTLDAPPQLVPDIRTFSGGTFRAAEDLIVDARPAIGAKVRTPGGIWVEV